MALLVASAGIVEDITAIDEQSLEGLVRVSRQFECLELETVVENHRRDEDYLSPSIGTYLNDLTGRAIKELLLDTGRLADIVFNVDGLVNILGHAFCLISFQIHDIAGKT